MYQSLLQERLVRVGQSDLQPEVAAGARSGNSHEQVISWFATGV